MNYRETMIAWNVGKPEIEVGPWPDRHGWSDRYEMTTAPCEADMRQRSPDQLLAQLFINFNTIVVRDRVPTEAAHQAFMAINEYRDHIAPDTETTLKWWRLMQAVF